MTSPLPSLLSLPLSLPPSPLDNLPKQGQGLLVLPGGRVIAAGQVYRGTSADFLLIRYEKLDYGSNWLDPSFGDGGWVTTDFGAADAGRSAAFHFDGKILVGGRSRIGATDDFSLARYNSNGSLDTSFSGDGKVTTDFNLGEDEINRIRVQSDSKIVAVGSTLVGSDRDFAIARYTSNGSLDSSFGLGGTTTIDFAGADDQASELLLQTNGKLLLIGSTNVDGDRDFALVRLNSDGTLDSTFGNAGRVTTDFAGLDDQAFSAVVQSDGKIVVVGSSATAMGKDFALARYNANGTLDTSFRVGGKGITDFAGYDDEAVSVHVQPSGKLIVTGTVGNAQNSDFGVARYNPNGTLDTNFASNGKLTIGSERREVAAESVFQNGRLTILGTRFDQAGETVELAQRGFSELSLSNGWIAEDQPIGTLVGTFRKIDLFTYREEVSNGSSYQLVSGAGSGDNGAFEIVGNQLRTKAVFDYETKNSYEIRVRLTDASGDLMEQALMVYVNSSPPPGFWSPYPLYPPDPIPPAPSPSPSPALPFTPSPSSYVVPQRANPPGKPILGDRENNRLAGTTRDDLMGGLKGSDRLLGRAGNDILLGGQGNDWLKGDVGDDVLKGGQGKDIYQLQQNGIDTIYDFRRGQDKLQLPGNLTFGSLTLTQQGSDTLIGVGGQVFAIVAKVQPSQLTAADCI